MVAGRRSDSWWLSKQISVYDFLNILICFSTVSFVPSSITKPFSVCCLEISDGLENRYRKTKSDGIKTKIFLNIRRNAVVGRGREIIQEERP